MGTDKEKNTTPKREVHSVLTVVSSTPVKPGTTWKVGPLGHAMGQHDINAIFYYKQTIPFDKIRPALNEILSFCPNVTGRLYKDGDGNWEIKCNDAGLRVFLAKVGRVSVDEWLRSAAGVDDEILLTAAQDLPEDRQFWSPFRIQVTEFEGGGTSIAMSGLHMLADPTSLTIFIKSWSETHLKQPLLHQPYFLPHALISNTTTTTTTTTPTTTFYTTKSNTPPPSSTLDMRGATFCFSNSSINHFLSTISDSSITPFDILAALFLTRVAILRNKHQHFSTSICLDIRKRMEAPLPYGYFGNALHFSHLDLDGVDLSHVAASIHRHVEGLNEEEFKSAINWLDSRKDEKGKYKEPFRMYGPEMTCVNMEHTIAPNGTHSKECEPLMYMASFEKDEKPVHVSYRVGTTDGEGLIVVMPSPEGGLARRVYVSLAQNEMDKLMNDDVILGFGPTLLLSGPKSS